MCDLESINYIHSLFVCEFQCNEITALTLRNYLIERKDLHDLLFEYTKFKCLKTSLPTYLDGNRYWIFKNEDDKQIWIDHFKLQKTSLTPRLSYLFIAKATRDLDIIVVGSYNLYALKMVKFSNPTPYAFMERRKFHLENSYLEHTHVSEKYFVARLVDLLQKLTSRNKIPFSDFNVQ